LMVPKIASLMGAILYRLSIYSPLLRNFLGIMPPNQRKAFTYKRYSLAGQPERIPIVQQLGELSREVVQMFWGKGEWVDADPVWWRNSVGLGLFIVVSTFSSLPSPFERRVDEDPSGEGLLAHLSPVAHEARTRDPQDQESALRRLQHR
jgi:hypothetical protein